MKELHAGLGIVVGLGFALHFLDSGKGKEAGVFFAGGHADEEDEPEFAFQILGVGA